MVEDPLLVDADPELRFHQIFEGRQDQLDPEGAPAAFDVGAEAPVEVLDRQTAAGGEGPVDALHVGQDRLIGRQFEIDDVVDPNVVAVVDLAVERPGVFEVVERRFDGLELGWCADDFDADDIVDALPIGIESDAPRSYAVGDKPFCRPAHRSGGAWRADAVERIGTMVARSAGGEGTGNVDDFAGELLCDPARDLVGDAANSLAANNGGELAVREGHQAHPDGSARKELLRQLAVPVDELGHPRGWVGRRGDDRGSHLVFVRNLSR